MADPNAAHVRERACCWRQFPLLRPRLVRQQAERHRRGDEARGESTSRNHPVTHARHDSGLRSPLGRAQRDLLVCQNPRGEGDDRARWSSRCGGGMLGARPRCDAQQQQPSKPETKQD